MAKRRAPSAAITLARPIEPALRRAARLGDHAAICALHARVDARDAAREDSAASATGAGLDALSEFSDHPGVGLFAATPLMIAAQSDDGATEDTVRLLLELGADPRVVVEGRSAATFALERVGRLRVGRRRGDTSHAARARILLDAGSPLPASPWQSNRLLCRVCEAGDEALLGMLLARGVSAQGHWDSGIALERGRRCVAAFEPILARQKQPFEVLPESVRQDILRSIREHDEERFQQEALSSCCGEMPLFRAAASGNAACVTLLLEAGADPLARDSFHRTAMYHAGSEAVVRALQRAGVPIEDRDEFGRTPLHDATLEGEASLPRVLGLLACGADANARCADGTPIFLDAVGSGRHPALLRALVGAGADPHVVDRQGFNAFHAALDVNFEASAEDSVRETFGYLKHLGVDIEHRTANGETPLARAILIGSGAEVRALCELGAEPHVVCRTTPKGGYPNWRVEQHPLILAAMTDVEDVDEKVDALLSAGANPLVKYRAATAFHCAVARLCIRGRYLKLHGQFYDGLPWLGLEDKRMPRTREAYLPEAIRVLLEYVERFEKDIPIDETLRHERAYRAELVRAIVMLGAHEAWARRIRVGPSPSPFELLPGMTRPGEPRATARRERSKPKRSG